jgi:hypothetical protein
MRKFLLLLLVTLSCAGVFAQQRPVVAVAPFDGSKNSFTLSNNPIEGYYRTFVKIQLIQEENKP